MTAPKKLKRCPAHDWSIRPEREGVECDRCYARLDLGEMTPSCVRRVAEAIRKRNPGTLGEDLAKEFREAVKVAELNRLRRFRAAEANPVEVYIPEAALAPVLGFGTLLFYFLLAALGLYVAAYSFGKMLAG